MGFLPTGGGGIIILLGLYGCIIMVQGAAFDKRALNPDLEGFSQYDMKHKRPFCNAFSGCGRKRSDASLEISELEQEAEKLGARMLGDIAPMDSIRGMHGMQRLHPDGNQFGFFPGYLK